MGGVNQGREGGIVVFSELRAKGNAAGPQEPWGIRYSRHDTVRSEDLSTGRW